MLYFKHHSTMRHDLKMKRVISRYGLEGYGLYCLILESITESLSDDSPMPDLSETCEDIAEFYNGNTARINEIANFMINQGLFDLSEMDGHIVCHKLYKFLDTSATRSDRLRSMISSYKKTMSLTVCDMSRTNLKEKEEEKEIDKEEEKKNIKKKVTKHKHGEYQNVRLTDDEYSRLLSEWGEPELLRMIKSLDEGMELKGYKYKSHNLALRKWREKDGPAKKTERELVEEYAAQKRKERGMEV